MTVVIWSCYTC